MHTMPGQGRSAGLSEAIAGAALIAKSAGALFVAIRGGLSTVPNVYPQYCYHRYRYGRYRYGSRTG